MVTGIFAHTAWVSMNRHLDAMNVNAAEIASARQFEGTSERDISQPLLEQTQNLRHVQASAKVIQADHDLSNYILDVLA
ncbi:hypothetical protein SAMN05421644_10355 [Allochromatium warmingii]|uniref:Uncharacterized protein n=1 Tax=Allochromatium warmingii TaxID=61595 RepID=A0A1H3BJY7_ALLWA|nr:hypothetical protein [Allochromatium warmingii]SDX42197.1 hypothetical protein SAMN05421644_10355 [Allochromatium warmingii]